MADGRDELEDELGEEEEEEEDPEPEAELMPKKRKHMHAKANKKSIFLLTSNSVFFF